MAEIEEGKMEPVITLSLSYGFLGIYGDEDLTVHLSLQMARFVAQSLQRQLSSFDTDH